MFDWRRRCAYDGAQKKLFHQNGRTALRALAKELRLPPNSFDIRSCLGGVAVSGEIILHGENIYIQLSQPATGADSGILIRSCNGRRDYEGGRNHFAPLSLLDEPAALASDVRAVMSGDLSRISAMFRPLAVKRLARGRG
ncbi:hypothetical protein [Methylocystis sp. B8]|uniref:hypothetical protein n=1 Tax=Methylocystis sp. B8 TaxID=544938 RepID=UPI001AEF1E39|nr:hypothetical protein [Methylocystis sp. B8]